MAIISAAPLCAAGACPPPSTCSFSCSRLERLIASEWTVTLCGSSSITRSSVRENTSGVSPGSAAMRSMLMSSNPMRRANS